MRTGKDLNTPGSKKKSPRIEIGDNLDDNEPLGSLFKIKKLRKSKQNNLGLEAAENPNLKDHSSYEMDDTLASFRRKLKAPKTNKADLSGTSKKLDKSSSDVAGKCVENDLNTTLNKASFVENKIWGRKLQIDVKLMKEDNICERTKGADQSFDLHESHTGSIVKVKSQSLDVTKTSHHSSDDGMVDSPSASSDVAMDDSLSAFVRKATLGSVKRVRSSKDRNAEKNEMFDISVTNDHLGVHGRKNLLSSAKFFRANPMNQTSDEISKTLASVPRKIGTNLSKEKALDFNVTQNVELPSKTEDRHFDTLKTVERGSNRKTDFSMRNLDSSITNSTKDLCLRDSVEDGTEKIQTEYSEGLNKEPYDIGLHEQHGGFFGCSLAGVLHDEICASSMKVTNETDKSNDGFKQCDSKTLKCREQINRSSRKNFRKTEHLDFADMQIDISDNVDLNIQISDSPSSLSRQVDGHILPHRFGKMRKSDQLCHEGSDDGVDGRSEVNISVSSLDKIERVGIPSTIDREESSNAINENVRSFDHEADRMKVHSARRALRKAKKVRHGDMAYEGDNDWDSLMQDQSIFGNNLMDGSVSTRGKDKAVSLLNSPDNGRTAAVMVGLKARKALSIEKIKFKDILKRRGGLQEYLECRNTILGLWSRNVSHILTLADCGITDIPVEDEPARVSLLREIYSFLNQRGYINVGITSEMESRCIENCKSQVLDEDEMVISNHGWVMVSENLDAIGTYAKESCQPLEEVKEASAIDANERETSKLVSSNSLLGSTEYSPDKMELDMDGKNSYVVESSPANESPRNLVTVDMSEKKVSFVEGTTSPLRMSSKTRCNMTGGKNIIIIGAGPSGLTAARHLQNQGFCVTVLEARSRIGGRVCTDHSSLSVPVDLGASIITGVEADVATDRRPDPSSLICAQLGLELMVLNSDCPLYDTVTGERVPIDLDEDLEAEYNNLLDDMITVVSENGEASMTMSLEEGLEYALARRRREAHDSIRLKTEYEDRKPDDLINFKEKDDAKVVDADCSNEEPLNPLERRVMNWHFAHLEYGCAAMLKAVSLPHWNQDDVYGGFGGPHCMIKGGYSQVVESLGTELNIHLNHVVSEIVYSLDDLRGINDGEPRVIVSTTNGSEFVGDAVLITVPLGCLKENTIKFSPSLPDWKQSSIQRLGFGVLNKVILEFSVVFWDDTVDYFGATSEETDSRGQCFMFWNVRKTVGAPVLIALVAGKAALYGQDMTESEHVNYALMVLRKLFGEASVPDPIAYVVTNWGRDPFSRGAYSYVAVGASGEDYDTLGRPVGNCVFFAGEATCKEHPDTVGGAMLSGLREAVRISDILNTGNDYTAEVDAMEAAQKCSNRERNEMRDMAKRLEAIEFYNVDPKNNPDISPRMRTKEILLQEMFANARTTSGRLYLSKELLHLPVQVLKSFAGTKEGLSTLNSWILDSMGKDATQLLRHCVRLLVLVSTDLLAVRDSGIGKTIKEKVCNHTSRDIRAIASQLVNVWIEVFRKEKAANGGLKLIRPTSTTNSSKTKPKHFSAGKPPLYLVNEVSDIKGSGKVSSLIGSPPLNASTRRTDCKPSKMEPGTTPRSDISHSMSMKEDSEENESNIMTEEEAAAFAAAEAAHAAALEAAKAYASSEAECKQELPKIPSFHKFARRELYAQTDDLDLHRGKWPSGVLGKQDCVSEIDSRNCKVRNWSVEFSATCVNLDHSRISGDNYTQQNHMDEFCNLNLREHSGESGAFDSSLMKAWVDSAGSGGVKDSSAIERWQSQAVAADPDFYHANLFSKDEEDSTQSLRPFLENQERQTGESPVSQTVENKMAVEKQQRKAERIKQAVIDYVASLLMPLYKARKIDKDGYKSIMKKSSTKIMENTSEAEKTMHISEFLDLRRKNKIRAFVDKLIERHMAVNQDEKS